MVGRALRQNRQATLLDVRMGEGRNRQIRRTAEQLGHPVRDLQRLAIGPIRLGALEEGQWRRVSLEGLPLAQAQPSLNPR